MPHVLETTHLVQGCFRGVVITEGCFVAAEAASQALFYLPCGQIHACSTVFEQRLVHVGTAQLRLYSYLLAAYACRLASFSAVFGTGLPQVVSRLPSQWPRHRLSFLGLLQSVLCALHCHCLSDAWLI